MNEPNTMWIKVFTADGTPISLTLAIDTVSAVNTRLQEIANAGLLLKEPAGNENTEEIAAVVRRKSKNGHTVVDLYPNWKMEGKFGEFKFAHVYLGTDAEIAEFEAQSGLKLSDLPVYPGQGAIVRTYGQTNEFERPVKRAFRMTKTLTGEDENGRNQYQYRYAAPLNSPTPRNGSEPHDTPSAQFGEVVISEVMTVMKNGKPYLMAHDVYVLSRQVFKDAGIDVTGWENPGVHKFPAKYVLKWESDGQGGKRGVEVILDDMPF